MRNGVRMGKVGDPVCILTDVNKETLVSDYHPRPEASNGKREREKKKMITSLQSSVDEKSDLDILAAKSTENLGNGFLESRDMEEKRWK
ncbi:hypothetical protein MRB53_005932 [Persea americana]|uniref:Uncharacterized protein n=1 Tax=Persea americana TaxID=3435 RepID=A0ACC2MER3_PERAE|nr:hypothetical protein MRB53_005932 [Persea americana]